MSFHFDLPAHLIAQEPRQPRDHSRLMVLYRHNQSLAHHHFYDLPDLLSPGDLLIVNDTRVLAARLMGQRQATGGKWEGLFLRDLGDGSWEMLCQTGGKLQAGEIIVVDPPPLELRLLGRLGPGRWAVQPLQAGTAADLLTRFGHVPLPPYIHKGQDRPEDRERYQTIFAKEAGAVAAPTAGLHFTPELLARLEKRGIARSFVTLHVGLGTFQPLQTEDFTQHIMHHELGHFPEATVQAIVQCRARGGRVVAVGTTSVRVLETVAATGSLRPWSGETNLFIYPPYQFQLVDALITNFHLPRTTLLLLVSAFAGTDFLAQAYRTAINEEYRFFSYGDAMLIL